MNIDTFTLGEPQTYDLNVMRISPQCPLAIPTPNMSFKRVDGKVHLIFDRDSEKHCDFYKRFLDLEDRIWEKSESSLRGKIPKITTDDMFRGAIDLPTKLSSPLKIVLDEITEDEKNGDLPDEGRGTFLLALKYVKTTPTSSRCVWFIPVFRVRKKKEVPPPPPKEYSYEDIEISDDEEENDDDCFEQNRTE